MCYNGQWKYKRGRIPELGCPVFDLIYLSSLIITGNAGNTVHHNSNSSLLELLSEVIIDSFLKHQLKLITMKWHVSNSYMSWLLRIWLENYVIRDKFSFIKCNVSDFKKLIFKSIKYFIYLLFYIYISLSLALSNALRSYVLYKWEFF